MNVKSTTRRLDRSDTADRANNIPDRASGITGALALGEGATLTAGADSTVGSPDWPNSSNATDAADDGADDRADSWGPDHEQPDLLGLTRTSLTGASGARASRRINRFVRTAGAGVLILGLLILEAVAYPNVQRWLHPASGSLAGLPTSSLNGGCPAQLTTKPSSTPPSPTAATATAARVAPTFPTWSPQGPYLTGCIGVTNMSGRRTWDGDVRLLGIGDVRCANAPLADSTWHVHVAPTETVYLFCAVTSVPESSGRVIPAHAFAGSWPDHWPDLNDALLLSIDNPAPFHWVTP